MIMIPNCLIIKFLAKGEAERIADEALQAEQQAEKEAAEGLIRQWIELNVIIMFFDLDQAKDEADEARYAAEGLKILCVME